MFRLLLCMCVMMGMNGVQANAHGFSIAVDDDSTDYAHTRESLKAAIIYGMPGEVDVPSSVYEGTPFAQKKRSVGAAFGMSAVIPGLGQAYNKQWGKAIGAFVLEAAVITSSIVWRNEGNDLERDYQLFAHDFWDPAKYASWLNDYSSFIDVQVTPIQVPTGIDFQNPGSWSDSEWQQVLGFFDQIQAVERQMYHIETGAAFSHTLPDFSEQQYYELIGKYYQFAPGWNDYPDWRDGNGEINAALIDPNRTGSDEDPENVTPTFFQYADDHAHANDVLRRASRITGLLIVTHMVSAIDAAVSAKLHNDRITPGLEIGANANGDVRPVATLTIKL